MNMPWLHHAKAAATDFVRELWSTDGLLNYLTAKTYFLIVALYQVPSAETWRLQLRELATVERNVNITHSVVDSIGSSVSMCLLPAATPIQERIASDRSEVARAVSSSLNAVRRVRLARSAFLIELVRTKDIRTNKVLSTSLETKCRPQTHGRTNWKSWRLTTNVLTTLKHTASTALQVLPLTLWMHPSLLQILRKSPLPCLVNIVSGHDQEDLAFAPTEVVVDDEGDVLPATTDEAHLFTTFRARYRYTANNSTVVGYKSVPFHAEDVRLWRQQRLAHVLPTVAEKTVGPSDQLGKRFQSKTSPKATADEMADDTADKTPDFWGEVLNPSSWPHISPPTTPPPSNVATAVFGEHRDGHDQEDLAFAPTEVVVHG
ncbi:hypothetical protein DYB34_007786 [Aphanomyces astaci]|uniref:Uncharacterized protein n=1 Tax=Aphanomyces astaci TaxID=112090 RepID=A0A3R6ZDT3_APHAT|nr:hypothetical protein DYB34_007786 [Aphanomyces astaci]